MGKGFGNLYYIRNIVYFKVSSYEQKAFPDFWKSSFSGLWSDVKWNVPYMIIPFTVTYLSYNWAQQEYDRLIRKDPALYANDED